MAVVANIGNKEAKDVKVETTIEYGLLIRPRTVIKTLESLAVDESHRIKVRMFGIGLGIFTFIPEITVTASA